MGRAARLLWPVLAPATCVLACHASPPPTTRVTLRVSVERASYVSCERDDPAFIEIGSFASSVGAEDGADLAPYVLSAHCKIAPVAGGYGVYGTVDLIGDNGASFSIGGSLDITDTPQTVNVTASAHGVLYNAQNCELRYANDEETVSEHALGAEATCVGATADGRHLCKLVVRVRFDACEFHPQE